jgi:hypothetical protein
LTWADFIFGSLLAAFCIAGLLLRRHFGGLNRKPPERR